LFDSLYSRRELRRVVVMSSKLVCRLGYRPAHDEDYCPRTSYGASKIEAEKIVRKTPLAAVPWVIARPTSIWGPWFGEPYLAFFMAISRGRYVHPKRCSVHRSYGYVLNSVHQLISLAEADHDSVCGRTFYICDYDPLELGAWADRIAATMNIGKPKRVSLSLLRLMARGGDALNRMRVHRAPLTSFRLANMLTDAVFDTADLRAITGALPYSIEEALQATVGWMRDQGLIQDRQAVRAA
jgi:nucleoside-diphosphate-sugar epimerase